MHKKLFIPGPIEVSEDVLIKMATPMIGHRSKEASELQKRISEKLKKVFQTNNEILLSTSSGSGLMEGAIRCCTAKKAAVFSVGAFGDRWYEMAKANNVPAELFEAEWGTHTVPELIDSTLSTNEYDLVTITHNETSTGIMNNISEISEVMKKYPEVVWCVDAVSSMGGTSIEVDRAGIDICITSSQKAIGLPPGLSMCSLSQKAYERAEKVPFRGMYFDLVKLYDFIKNKNYQYPTTPSLSHMFALDYSLDKILQEGLPNRYRRHLEMAEYTREWAKENFKLYPEENYLSDTLTVINNTRNINVSELNKKLGDRGFAISNGYGKLKEKTFRIAHMGDCTLLDIKELIDNINDIIGI